MMFYIFLDNRKSKKTKHKLKTEKKEKQAPEKKQEDNEKLMSVLELLELQARARAIRSQLALEAQKRQENATSEDKPINLNDNSDSDSVIIESPKCDEIVISSSDSENESKKSNQPSDSPQNVNNTFKEPNANGASTLNNDNIIDSKGKRLKSVKQPPKKTSKTSHVSNSENNDNNSSELINANDSDETLIIIDDEEIVEKVLEADERQVSCIENGSINKDSKLMITFTNKVMQKVKKSLKEKRLLKLKRPPSLQKSNLDLNNETQNEDNVTINCNNNSTGSTVKESESNNCENINSLEECDEETYDSNINNTTELNLDAIPLPKTDDVQNIIDETNSSTGNSIAKEESEQVNDSSINLIAENGNELINTIGEERLLTGDVKNSCEDEGNRPNLNKVTSCFKEETEKHQMNISEETDEEVITLDTHEILE